jgi:hypothetical protein
MELVWRSRDAALLIFTNSCGWLALALVLDCTLNRKTCPLHLRSQADLIRIVSSIMIDSPVLIISGGRELGPLGLSFGDTTTPKLWLSQVICTRLTANGWATQVVSTSRY